MRGVHTPHERAPFGSDLFRAFFERFFGETSPQARQSLGSGFLIKPEGLILTNHGGLKEADKIKGVSPDEREFEARIIGCDPKTDLVIIKVQSATPLPTVPPGNSDTLRLGEWVMVIGNLFDLSHTVTADIVSAKARVIGAGQYDDFIPCGHDSKSDPGTRPFG